MQREFHIPEQNLHGLKAKLQKLAKKAEKTGLPLPELRYGISLNERINGSNGPLIIKYRKVILNWEPVANCGWHVVGKLMHLPEGNLVRSFGYDELPMHYRNASPDCDHCQVKRKRLSTYIIQDETGSFKQVGDDCLTEYLRIDSRNIINAVKVLSSILDTVQASEALPAIGRTPDMWPLEVYLSHVADCIKEFGWISRKQARIDGIIATADKAFERLSLTDKYNPPTAGGVAEAAKAIEWAESIPDGSSEYLHNLHIIAMSGAVEYRSLGYAASIIPTFHRDVSGEEIKESGFVGNVGDRSEFTLKVERIIDIDSSFGEQFVHIMKDADQNVFVWKTKDRLDEDKTYKLKGRIKEHKDYNGIKQTHLFYCKLVS